MTALPESGHSQLNREGPISNSELRHQFEKLGLYHRTVLAIFWVTRNCSVGLYYGSQWSEKNTFTFENSLVLRII